MANSILLTVASQNNQNLSTSVPTVFEVSKMGSIRANQNAATTPTFTPASALGTSAWNIVFEKGVVRPTKLYFSVKDNGSTNDCTLYADADLTRIVAKTDTAVGDTAVATLVTKNNSGISGNVTLAGSNTGNSDITIALESANSDLELAGATEFSYLEPSGVIKYTVTEAVADIQTSISDENSLFTVTKTLTAAEVKAMATTPVEIIAAPGAGTAIQIVSGVVSIDYASAAYATHDDVDIQFSTLAGGSTIIGTADGVLAATADAVKAITITPGTLVINDAVVISDKDGDPATGDSPVKVSLTYRVIAV